MKRGTFLFGSLSALLASFPMTAAFAQQPEYVAAPRHHARGAVYYGAQGEVPSRLQTPHYARPISLNDAKSDRKVPPPTAGPTEGAAAAQAGIGGVYPYLGAPLYPSPVQRVPVQVGATVITNQALYPHEMLYPHEYCALYPPFYYRVKGSWIWTPFGIRSHDKWKLQGTQVNVKYRSEYSLFSAFCPPYVK